MKPLFAKLVKFDLPGEILSDNVLDFLADRRFERVFIDFVEIVNFVPVDIFGAFEKPRDILFKN